MKPIFQKNIFIKFGEADPQGILYFARAPELAHECLEEFWNSTPLGWGYWFQNPEFAVPLRQFSCDYFRPMHVGETYSVVLSVVKVGDSSVQFICEFFEDSTQSEPTETRPRSICAKISTIHVFVDRENFAKIGVPEPIRELLQ